MPHSDRAALLNYHARLYNSRKQIVVYRVYDGNELVYVGRTHALALRLSNHRRREKWWKDRFTVEVDTHQTYGDSLVAEAILIRDNQPRFNTDGVTR